MTDLFKIRFSFYAPARLLACVASLLCLACPSSALAGQNNIPLVAHKSLYSFRLASLGTTAGLTAISGQVFYEQDDTCDAWTTDHRATMEYYYAGQPPQVNASHYVAFESKDAQQFHFNSERQEGGKRTERLRGALAPDENGTAVAQYTRPPELAFDLPQGYLLPTNHTIEVIRRARQGERFFSSVLFDGTDAEGPVEVNAFIGHKLTAVEIATLVGQNSKIDSSLLSPDAWKVRMAIFPLATKDDMTPVYEMQIVLHDNGVVSHTLVDYDSFSLEQVLEALEKIPARKCL